ncbi:MAG: alpha/beta hydrolase, partial [Deltaproteobacteria bacterium]|nr:alpha/beta hydrolase [Deltaproteobacteria bacterium]
MDLIFKDPQYSFQCLRTIGYAPSGGADIGECLSTAYRITEGDDESWYTEWVKTARRLEQAADTFLKAGHTISAREAYFRASNYYRTAEFFLHTNPRDPRIMETWGKSRSCFIKAARLSNPAITPVEIPFEGTTLPGYLCLADNKGIKKPLIIIHSGFDGTGEELYFEIAWFAIRRGYNCLLFEGPGQGRVIRKQKIHFRPNWETVVTPVVDFALTLPVVDPERIVLMGISMGGYLAPRAAAFEKRIAVCIPNGGLYDFHAGAVGHFPPEIR